MYTICTVKNKAWSCKYVLTSLILVQLGSCARAERMHNNFWFKLDLFQPHITCAPQKFMRACCAAQKFQNLHRFCFNFQINFSYSFFNQIDSFKNSILNGKQTCSTHLFVTPLAILNCQIVVSYFLIFMIQQSWLPPQMLISIKN